MVSSGSKFSRSGLSDWLIQRASAVVLGLYVLVLGWVLLRSPALDFAEWSLLFDGLPMKIATSLALLALCAHSWIGMWTVATDYLTESHFGRGGTSFRIGFLCFCILLILGYLVWGFQIVWSN
jgi:succinate dehydrogenase / fumarate reductase membrane anchor subunit